MRFHSGSRTNIIPMNDRIKQTKSNLTHSFQDNSQRIKHLCSVCLGLLALQKRSFFFLSDDSETLYLDICWEQKSRHCVEMKPISFSIRTPHNVLHQQNTENARIREFFLTAKTIVSYTIDITRMVYTERYHISQEVSGKWQRCRH